MPFPDPDPSLELALAVIGYQWALRRGDVEVNDAIHGLERLREEAAAFPAEPLPLAQLYPHVARLAALSLNVLATLGDPGEVDGLKGFEAFDHWRESR